MIKSFRRVYPFYILVDVVLTALIFYLSYLFRYNTQDNIFNKMSLPYFKAYSFIFILWSIFILVLFKRAGLYTTDRGLSIPKEIFKVGINIFYSTILVGSVIFFAQYSFFSRKIFLLCFILLCVILSSWRVTKRVILRKMILDGFHNINVLIIGANKIGRIIANEIQKNPFWGFRVIGFLGDIDESPNCDCVILGKPKDFSKVVKRYFIDEIIIAMFLEKRFLTDLIQQTKNMRLGIKVVPENFDEALPVLDTTHLGPIVMLTYVERRRHPAEFALKRIFDFIVSLSLLLVLSPLFVIIVILIKLNSEGPILYVQERVGFKGKTFRLYKFRSMVKDAENLKSDLLVKNEVKDGIIFKIKNDPRITKIGIFLRRYSLDELLQLINVLKGDMSLVGPRPPVPEEVEKYSHEQMERLSIRPGITCLSQVRGRSELTFYQWARWDSWYINNWSFVLDLRILLLTIPAVFRGKGAY